MLEINSAADMEAAVNKLDESQREHLRIVITELIRCYIDDKYHGMVLVSGEDDPFFKMVAVNSTDMEAYELLRRADEYVALHVMKDAPPKEQFN